MRPSGIINAVNWRHAVGELFLIVVGILIALAISDWNDQRIERIQERALLDEIRSTLESDAAALESNLKLFTDAAQQINTLSNMLKEPPPYQPSMDKHFGVVYGLRITNLNTAAYETLKSVGLQSVSDRELRAAIARVFDFHYERLIGSHEIEREVNINVLRPYYLRHFRDLRFYRSATPIDYDAVVHDTHFKNIVHYRHQVLVHNQVSYYSDAIKDMGTTLEMLDAVLSH